MSLIVTSFTFVALSVCFGAAVLRVVSTLPLAILAQAEEGGRYVRLGAEQASSPATPASGRKIRTLVPAHGYAA